MIISLLAAVSLLGAASPQDPRAIDAIRSVLTRENAMYESFDASVAPTVYASDIRWQNPFGVRFENEPDLQAFLTRLFSRPGFRSAKTVSRPVITRVTLLSPGVASAWSEEASEGQVYADGKPVGLRKSHILYALRKEARGWIITDEMIMDEK